MTNENKHPIASLGAPQERKVNGARAILVETVGGGRFEAGLAEHASAI